jgi:hypothetical protein
MAHFISFSIFFFTIKYAHYVDVYHSRQSSLWDVVILCNGIQTQIHTPDSIAIARRDVGFMCSIYPWDSC